MNNNKKTYQANDYMCKVHKANIIVADISRLEEMEERGQKEKAKCSIIKKEENCKKEGNMLRCG